MVTATQLAKAGDRALAIDWDDGHRSIYDVVELRRQCPCAQCVDEWTGKRLLHPRQVDESVRPRRIVPVGKYAVSIEWTDGHSTGIYSFEFLRSKCPCPDCEASRESEPDGDPPRAGGRARGTA